MTINVTITHSEDEKCPYHVQIKSYDLNASKEKVPESERVEAVLVPGESKTISIHSTRVILIDEVMGADGELPKTAPAV